MGSQHEVGRVGGILSMKRGITKVDHRAVVARESDPLFASIALHGPWFGGHQTGVTEPPRLTSDSIVYGGPQGWNPHSVSNQLETTDGYKPVEAVSAGSDGECERG